MFALLLFNLNNPTSTHPVEGLRRLRPAVNRITLLRRLIRLTDRNNNQTLQSGRYRSD